MTSIGHRILLIAMACLAAVVVVAGGLTLARRGIERDLRDQEALQSALRLWERSVQQEGERLRTVITETVRVEQAAGVPEVAAGRLDARVLAELARRGLASVVFYDDFGKAGFRWPEDDATPIESARLSQVVSTRGTFEMVRFVGGVPRLVTGGTLPRPLAGSVAFVVTGSFERVLGDVSESIGASAFLLDADGRAAVSKGQLHWDELRGAFAARGSDLLMVSLGGQRYELTVVPLRDPVIGLQGYLCVARDATLVSRWLEVVDSLTVGLMIVFCVVLLAFLRWFLTRNLAPLGGSITALSALAEGDTGVEVQGAQRQDEVGMIARSIAVFRDRNRKLRDSDERRLRQWHRQQEFIQVQMRQLAATLPEDGRQAFLGDLERIEAATGGAGPASSTGEGGSRALAVAFEIMAERVCEQHERLDKLVRELSAALETRTELFALQQQVEVARRMQESMLPRGLPPRADIEVAGALLPAAEFDGGFYDFFALSEDGALALTLGQPAKGGLVSGFASANARTALRALLSAGMAPGECLARTARLLAGDEHSVGYSLAAAVLRPAELKLSWAAAGVDPPTLVRRLGDAVVLPFDAEPALTGDPSRTVVEHAAAVPSRASLLILSPGVVSPDMPSALGRDRVLSVLREADDPSVGGVLETLRRGLLAHSGGQRGPRDRLCVGARLLV